MMDPISALALAACNPQFVGFGSKLFRQSKELSEAGSVVSVEHLATITRDLASINSNLQQPYRLGSSQSNEEQVRIIKPALHI